MSKFCRSVFDGFLCAALFLLLSGHSAVVQARPASVPVITPVIPIPKRSSDSILLEMVQAALRLETRIEHELLAVSVRAGTVYLEGELTSPTGLRLILASLRRLGAKQIVHDFWTPDTSDAP